MQLGNRIGVTLFYGLRESSVDVFPCDFYCSYSRKISSRLTLA